MTLEKLKDFHRRRLEVLAETGADLIAFETIPNKLEAQVTMVGTLIIFYVHPTSVVNLVYGSPEDTCCLGDNIFGIALSFLCLPVCTLYNHMTLLAAFYKVLLKCIIYLILARPLCNLHRKGTEMNYFPFFPLMLLLVQTCTFSYNEGMLV